MWPLDAHFLCIGISTEARCRLVDPAVLSLVLQNVRIRGFNFFFFFLFGFDEEHRGGYLALLRKAPTVNYLGSPGQPNWKPIDSDTINRKKSIRLQRQKCSIATLCPNEQTVQFLSNYYHSYL